MFWFKLGILFVAYVVTAKLGLQADAVAGFASLVWPPTGIALAAVFLGGYRLAPAIMAAAWAVNWENGAPFFSAVLIGVGNTLEALLGAYLLRRFARFQPPLSRVRDVSALVFFAALLSPLVSATIGVTSLWMGDIIPLSSFMNTWLAWWVGDAMGTVIVAPLLFAWAQNQNLRGHWPVIAEGLLLGAVLIGVSVLVFHGQPGFAKTPYIRPYFVFPVLVWSALRFSPRGAATALFSVAAIAIWGAQRGMSPFTDFAGEQSLLSQQLFMGVTATTILLLTAAMAEVRSAVRARDDFLSIASHELNTPIASLKLQLQLMLRNLRHKGPVDPDKILRLGERVDLQIIRLSRLVDTLLDVARISVGRLILTTEAVDLGRLVQDTLSASDAEHTDLQTIAIDIRQQVVGQWDRLRLEQMVANLVTNAIKYGEGKPINIIVDMAGDHGILRVRDQGIGIPASRQPFIFERFERAVSDRSYGGLGLGLYICRQIAEAHEGSIRVRSKPGEGSCFTLELPRKKPGSQLVTK